MNSAGIFITGAASGIGRATARLFHARGWRVGLTDRDAPGLQALSTELEGAWHRVVDVTDAAALTDAVHAFAADGRMRVMFNCAGVMHVERFEDMDPTLHARMVAVNVNGVVNGCHAAFGVLRGVPGATILNMSSASAVYGVPHFAVYSATKFAVRGLTEALEIEWREHGIRVCDLMPSFVRTPLIEGHRFDAPALANLGVQLTAEQLAEAAWRHIHGRGVHRTVGGLFRVLYWAGQFTPPALSRAVMARISR
jgi:NADP-dependent 3-hydroxy acid dehydrogenase YdfG